LKKNGKGKRLEPPVKGQATSRKSTENKGFNTSQFGKPKKKEKRYRKRRVGKGGRMGTRRKKQKNRARTQKNSLKHTEV